MAKTVGGFDSDTGNAKVRSGKVSRRAGKATEIPWTPGPGTSKLKRAARALWG
jgi:hypothetical protein